MIYTYFYTGCSRATRRCYVLRVIHRTICHNLGYKSIWNVNTQMMQVVSPQLQRVVEDVTLAKIHTFLFEIIISHLVTTKNGHTVWQTSYSRQEYFLTLYILCQISINAFALNCFGNIIDDLVGPGTPGVIFQRRKKCRTDGCYL